jgi:hypothetical protein
MFTDPRPLRRVAGLACALCSRRSEVRYSAECVADARCGGRCTDSPTTRPCNPWGVREMLEGAFVERRPYGESPGVYTQHARASNHLRSSLFRMANADPKRRNSAFELLAQIEEWRLERGCPAAEPRHSDFAVRRALAADEAGMTLLSRTARSVMI